MRKVYIGSSNPVKIQCTADAFTKVFPEQKFEFIGVSVDSGVSEQPMSDIDTYSGAENRARRLQEQYTDGLFWVGIEGGVEIIREHMQAFAWMVIRSRNMQGEARTATFPLPKEIKKMVMQGVELGHADDRVFKRTNSKQKDGAVGILTGGLIDRVKYYDHALQLALIPFINTGLY